MVKFKIILFPIGEHDTAGNKRLKNLAKYLPSAQNVNISFLNLYGSEKAAHLYSADLRSFLKRFFYSIFNTFYILYFLYREREKGSENILYFYEGENLMLHRVIVAKLLRYKIFIDLVENPNSINFTTSIIRKIRVVYFLMLYRIIPLYTNGIIVVSQYLKNKVIKDFKNKVPVFLMPVSFDPDDYISRPQQYDYPTIFYGGSYGNNYDFNSFFKAFKNIIIGFPRLKLFLSGNLNDELLNHINLQIGSINNLVFLGFLSEKEYFQTISSMDILCMPRNNSTHANAGFPFKLAEYLATGKPVITSRVSDIAYYVNDRDAFIYNPGDSEKIESLIRHILTNPGIAKLVGEKGRKKAQMHFNASTLVFDFMNFIMTSTIK
jgi:glycosyltransferase involved in cell wall biosynthesis